LISNNEGARQNGTERMKRREFLKTTALGATAGTIRGAGERPPNIVFIYADDIGYGDLSCYGATRVKTPNLDKLAGGGLRLTNAHAGSATCTPSRYSLLTGQYAWRRNDTGILPGDAPLLMHPGQQTVPAMLQAAGYRTACVGKWHLGLGNGSIDWNREIKPGPNEVGFNYSFVLPATLDRVPCVFVENHRVVNLDPEDPIEVSYEKPIPGEVTGKDHPELLKMRPSEGHDQAVVNGVGRIGYMKGGKSALWVDEDIVFTLTKKATAFIDDNRSRPFFLYYATPEIHVPRLPNRRFVGKTDMGPRGDSIVELDWAAGQVLEALERNGLTQSTLVLFSSDNGPVVDDGYRDEAVERLGSHKPAGIYRGGKYSNFDGGTRVPFIVRWPGHVKADSTSDALFSQVDLFGSLAALTGQKLAGEAAPDSFNALPAMLGQSKQGRPYLVEHAGSLAIIEKDWKFIAPSQGPKMNKDTNTELGNDPAPQLYDLHDDPWERNNVAGQQPERVRQLTELLNHVKAQAHTRN
jgi:arylsulfatase A-like enzyme